MNNSKITYTAEQLSQIIGVDVKCIEQNVSLAQRTWIHRGGTAAWWFTPNNYEDLIKAGANFASSPKRVNIHALDPAIIASCKSQHELDSYLYYLESDNLNNFKFFDIIYEVNPM